MYLYKSWYRGFTITFVGQILVFLVTVKHKPYSIRNSDQSLYISQKYFVVQKVGT
jgi:hypothetical protein